MSTVQTPDPDDTRITDNPDFRDGYCQGYLDALAAVKAATVADAAVPTDDGFAERFLQERRRSRAEQLVEDTRARWAEEHQTWLQSLDEESAR